MSNGDILMTKRPKNYIRDIVVNMIRNGDDNNVIMCELCHKYGLKIDNAKRNFRNAQALVKKQDFENEKVEVTTIFGTPAKVQRKYVGTMHDPSQERYWSF
jgi:hypothetical protein